MQILWVLMAFYMGDHHQYFLMSISIFLLFWTTRHWIF